MPSIIITKTAHSTNTPSLVQLGVTNKVVPGTKLTYTINYSNSGSTAYNVILQDKIKSFTTYISNSIYLNGVLQSNPASNIIISPVGIVAPGQKGKLVFSVVIK